MLKELKTLHDRGFALHWLKPKSKWPVESGWTKGPRKTWDELRSTWRNEYNVGVRLGEASKIGKGYLAVIDFDVKSQDKKHLEEAQSALNNILSKVSLFGSVMTGRGNSSGHYYILTYEPLAPRRIAQSTEKVKVLMPSVEPTKNEIKLLGPKDLNAGYRLRFAWEVAFMGEGQQVVLPPSTHPDSGRAYVWQSPLSNQPFTNNMVNLGIECGVKKTSVVSKKTHPFKAIEFDNPAFIKPLSAEVISKLHTEEGEQSEALLSVYSELIREKWTDDEILTLLTDLDYPLGEAGFRHRKTEDRAQAADWIWTYTGIKARENCDPKYQFTVIEEPQVSPEEKKEIEWQLALQKGDKGGLRHSLMNMVSLLKNGVASNLVKRDMFLMRDFYAVDVPWGRAKGDPITDGDGVLIKFWLAENFGGYEPNTGIIHEALDTILKENEFHPVRDWLNSLPEWDGIERLNTGFKVYLQAEGCLEYLAQVFRKFMVGLVTRIFIPGTKFDWMPILEGAQGVGKSSFANILASDPWFTDWLPNLNDKDAALALQGRLICEMPELADLRKAELEIQKGFISRTVDKVRPPYGRRQIELHRQCLFMGTTNRDEYLKDETGNRRFKPFKVGQLNFKLLRKDRPQLFAEALFIFRNELETTFELEGIARDFEAQIHAEKMVFDEADAMLEILQKKTTKLPEIISLPKLFEDSECFAPYKADMKHFKLAAKALRAFGYEKSPMRKAKVWKMTPKTGNIEKRGN